MKRNRKGFSLVELIVVLVIMAIIAALCAPNISAYVQAAKVQNYQTVANNLADELQTQLPQSRYWNWVWHSVCRCRKIRDTGYRKKHR